MDKGRRFKAAPIAAITILFLAELSARWLAPSVQEPLIWYDWISQTKSEQMEQLASDGTTSWTIFLGNSATMFAIDPAVVDQSSTPSRRSYNASIISAFPEMLEHWLFEEVLSHFSPERVVIGLTSFDLFGVGVEDKVLNKYFASPAARRGLVGDLDRLLREGSDLYRYRARLRSPEHLWAALRRRPSGIPPRKGLGDGVIGEMGQNVGEITPSYQVTEQVLRDFGDRWRDGFVESHRQMTALRRLLEQLLASGIEVSLIMLPVTSDYIDLMPHGESDNLLFEKYVEALASDLNIQLLMPPEEFRNEHLFFDPIHMNRLGMARFSRWLGEHLAPA